MCDGDEKALETLCDLLIGDSGDFSGDGKGCFGDLLGGVGVCKDKSSVQDCREDLGVGDSLARARVDVGVFNKRAVNRSSVECSWGDFSSLFGL